MDWTGVGALILAPGVPLTHPEPHWAVRLAKSHGVEIIGDVELFCRERRLSKAAAKIIAITGTNGKSTTTALTHHLLVSAGSDAVAGGNIGAAVFDLPEFRDDRYYVLELSSFQLDLTSSLDADAAALLNITPDHLDRHGSLANYAAVKAKIFENLRDGAAAVIGADDRYCDEIAARLLSANRTVKRVSAKSAVANGVYAEGSTLLETENDRIVNSASLEGIGSLRGAHNAQNAAAALALLRSLGFPWDPLARALRAFPGLPHRMEEVRRIGNVLFINDSKATNADAAERALSSFSNIYWIAGGKPKAGGIASLTPYFPRIKKAYLIGEAAPAFAETLKGRAEIALSGTLDKALAEAAADAQASGDAEAVVLLSPACASYDQFPNFEVRGNVFRKLAQALLDRATRGRAA
jgi:UDP-N-acetylmuramoylalanine--D-glutamate ligase